MIFRAKQPALVPNTQSSNVLKTHGNFCFNIVFYYLVHIVIISILHKYSPCNKCSMICCCIISHDHENGELAFFMKSQNTYGISNGVSFQTVIGSEKCQHKPQVKLTRLWVLICYCLGDHHLPSYSLATSFFIFLWKGR